MNDLRNAITIAIERARPKKKKKKGKQSGPKVHKTTYAAGHKGKKTGTGGAAAG